MTHREHAISYFIYFKHYSAIFIADINSIYDANILWQAADKTL